MAGVDLHGTLVRLDPHTSSVLFPSPPTPHPPTGGRSVPVSTSTRSRDHLRLRGPETPLGKALRQLARAYPPGSIWPGGGPHTSEPHRLGCPPPIAPACHPDFCGCSVDFFVLRANCMRSLEHPPCFPYLLHGQIAGGCGGTGAPGYSANTSQASLSSSSLIPPPPPAFNCQR